MNLGLGYTPLHIRFPIEQRLGSMINCNAVVRFIEGSSRLKGHAKALDVFRLETKIEAPKSLNFKSQLNPKHPEIRQVLFFLVTASMFSMQQGIPQYWAYKHCSLDWCWLAWFVHFDSFLPCDRFYSRRFCKWCTMVPHICLWGAWGCGVQWGLPTDSLQWIRAYEAIGSKHFSNRKRTQTRLSNHCCFTLGDDSDSEILNMYQLTVQIRKSRVQVQPNSLS